jgi:hypothetical protein
MDIHEEQVYAYFMLFVLCIDIHSIFLRNQQNVLMKYKNEITKQTSYQVLKHVGFGT